MKILTCLSFVCGCAPLVFSAQPKRPNIVIFLADDLGYADIGANGCQDIPTPHIDSIARNGVRFTDGYATGMVGKWHIGFKEGLRPHERGFDFHFGFLSGAHTYLPGNADNDPLLRNGRLVTDEKEYLTDAFAREAVAFLERSRDRPWFLYFAFNAVHSPMEATAAYTNRFPGLGGNRRTYAGMLSALDDAVGRVMAQVRALGQEENTLVFFYSDNGGPTAQTTSRNEPLRGFKGQLFEGGIRVPFLAQWKGTLPAGLVYRER